MIGPRPAHLRGCERCGQVENEKYLHGGLCLDCQWSDELTTEPAMTTAAPWGECAGCGRSWPTELCPRCDDTPAFMAEDYRP